MIDQEIKYDWEYCFHDGKNGHSLWFDKLSQRYSIKDQSGKFPHLTDDGVLWLVYGGKARVNVGEYLDDGLVVSFDLADGCHVSCKFDFGIIVAKELKMKIEICTPYNTRMKINYKKLSENLLKKAISRF